MIFDDVMDRIYGNVGVLIALTEGRVPEEYRLNMERLWEAFIREGKNEEDIETVREILNSSSSGLYH